MCLILLQIKCEIIIQVSVSTKSCTYTNWGHEETGRKIQTETQADT